MTKEEVKMRVELAKDGTPGTEWFIWLTAFGVAAVIAWAKLGAV